MAMMKQAVLDAVEASPIGCLTRSDLLTICKLTESDLDKVIYSLESEMVIVCDGNLVTLAD